MSPDYFSRTHRPSMAARRRLASRRAPLRSVGLGEDDDGPTFGGMRKARLRRLQRQVGLARRAIGFWTEQLDRTRAGLQAFEAELADETGEEPLEEGDYGDDYDTTIVETEPAGVPPIVEGEAAPVAAAEGEPDRRALFDVFDDMAEDEFTEDFYPRVDAVNKALAERGEVQISRDAMHPHFDRYLHDRIAEGQVAPPARWTDEGAAAPTGKPKKATDEVLFQAFRTLGSEDITADGRYPKVAEVRARIPAVYKPPSQQEIHAAWGRFKK
jgi:hypothetical protein